MKPLFFRRWLIVIGLMLVCLPALAQKRTISGYVMDAASKETLIGATVIDKNSGKGCATNNYGFYTLSSAGVVDEDAFLGRNTVLVVAAVNGDGARNAETVGPAVGQGTAVRQAEAATAIVAKQADVGISHGAY